jgi:tRNA(Ile)-lysidine synthase
VEHGLRAAESVADAAFVKTLCEKWKVPCTIVSIPPGKIAETAQKRGLGIEAAARLYRHRAWNKEARRIGAERILVAHTRDDLLETVLMRFLRGSGPAGLAAMPRRRGRIVRPLLDLRRADVLLYLAEKKIGFRTDSTNADNNFLRNRIRNKLIPCLTEFFPRWEKNLGALAGIQRLTAEFLKTEASLRVSWEQVPGGKNTELRTPAAPFFLQPEIIREEALFLGIDILNGQNPAKKRLKQTTVKRSSLRQFSSGEKTSADLGAYRIEMKNGFVIISGRRPAIHEEGFGLLINTPGLYKLIGTAIEVLPAGAGDSDGFFVSLPLVLRPSLKGDCIVKAGRHIHPADMDKKNPGSRLISVVGRDGIAAFIGIDNGNVKIETAGFVTAETKAAENAAYFRICISGGIDV